MTRPRRRPLVLAILDGFGLAPAGPHNAIRLARTPHWDAWWEGAPHTRLSAAGEDVGLPDLLMGNSEVGHLNLGAGRIVYQPLTRISKAIRDGVFYDNAALRGACAHVRATGGALHLIGLVSDGGVHSHLDHVPGFLELARREGVDRIFVHVFTDGRDTPPTAGVQYVARLEEMLAAAGRGRIATLGGRYWGMDRDKRWDRVQKHYDALVHSRGPTATAAGDAVRASYARDVSDEFIEPVVLVDAAGQPVGPIRGGDAVVHMNFRPDRAREMTWALTQEAFDGFDRGARLGNLAYVCLTLYDEKAGLPVAFPPERIADTLGDLYAAAGLSQLRIAETEKYAHVTYFFSGGREAPLAGEERCLVPSPKVATYDLMPEMSAHGVTDEVVSRLASDKHDLVVLNYANADMVGHSGVLDATVRAVEVIDGCLARVEEAVRARGGILAITADHGNAEQMWDEARNERHTAHTTNPVPLVLLGADGACRRIEEGILADVAPTLLDLVELPQPVAMTGRSLLVR